MYPVTRTVAENFKQNAVQYLSILVNPVTGSSFELTDADVLANGLNINRYSANGNSVVLGSCVASELTLEIENTDGRFNSVQFEGAQLTVSVGTQDGDNVGWVPMGLFTVDTAPRKLDTLSITALDGMVLFDKPVNLDALSLPAQVKNIVRACCNECNIVIDTDIDALPNSSYVVNSVGDTEDLTYRQILVWCCQLMGVCGFMDWQGHLELSWYKKDGIPETVSGSIATFESVTEVPVSQLIVNAEPYQNLNGYDKPWIGGAGKNVFNADGLLGGGQSSFTKNSDNNYTFAKLGTSSAQRISNRGALSVPEGTYFYSFKASAQSASAISVRLYVNGAYQTAIVMTYADGYYTASLTVPSGTTGLQIFYANNSTAVGTEITVTDMQLESGSTRTSYAPYENICPIYPANGKNILPNNLTWTSGLRDSNGNPTASGTSHYSNSFPCEPNTTYTGQGIKTESTSWRIYFLTDDETWISRTEQLTYAEESFTTPSNCYLMQVQCRYTNDLSTNAQIERGNSPTQYVPYKAIGITKTGANLLDNSLTNATIAGVAYTRNADGSITCVGTATNTSSTIQIAPSWKTPHEKGTYILKGTGANIKVRANTYDINGNLIARIADNGSGATIVLDDTAVKFSVMAYAGATVAVNETIYPILTHGTIATSYEPYTAEHYYSTSDNPVYGGTLDVVSGVLTVTHALRNFDNYTGSITKSSNSKIKAGRCVYYINTTDTPWSGGDNNPRGIVMKCSIYDIGSKGYADMIPKTEFAMGIGSYQGTYCMIGWNVDDSISTIAEFRTWLQSAHCDVWYPLRNPQTYQLTPTQVELLKGTNNIWADNSTLSVTFPAVTEITPADRFSSDIYENPITITGVSVKGEENEALFGSDEYALLIEGNELITDDDVETIADNLAGLVGFSYYPFQASTLPMPYLYPLDIVAVQYKGQWYDGALTEISFTASNATDMKSAGESAQTRSYARMNPLTNRERAIIENLKGEINETLNLAVNQAIDFNQIISNALGLYSTNISDGTGGFIRYLHNAPTLEDSTYIVTETAQGFAWTQSGWNGGSPVWSYGVTSGGYALFKWLSAEGIDVTKASSDYRAQVTPEYFNIYYKNDLIITIDATERAIKTPRMVIPYSATSNNMLRIGNAVWLPAPNGANLVVLEG